MPFGSQASLNFYDSLPPLEGAGERPGAPLQQQSLFEGIHQLDVGSSKTLFRLCIVDDEGHPRAYPSDADLTQLFHGSGAASGSVQAADATPKPEPQQPPAQQQQPAAAKEPSFQELLAATVKKGGPVCAHCGVTESPQWRRGPPNKAILCNACGTRYRRTNQLGSAVPSALRKRQAQVLQQQQQQHCSGEVMKHQRGPVAKQPRVSVA